MGKVAVKFEVLLPKDRDFPQKKFDKFEREAEQYMRGPLISLLRSEFEATVENWKHRPDFKITYSTPYNTRKQVTVELAGRYSLNWQRVSSGTRAHAISAKNVPTLSFQPFYTPHTRPGGKVFWGGPGTDSGDYVHPTTVFNPGIKPRHFSHEIARQNEEKIIGELKKIAEKAFK